jgi:hypothetical protein
LVASREMAQLAPVTLQINVAPTDLPHAVSVLPHQLRQWGGQVQEILFTLDLHRTAHGGRFGEAWEERKDPMEALLQRLCDEYPSAHVSVVDYTDRTVRDVAESFLDEPLMPAKDTKGAPIYPYFYGLYTAAHDYVLHLDSDLMFGGGSQTWVAEALELLDRHADVLACNPLAGPPLAEPALRGQRAARFEHDSRAFRFPTLSTRLFLIDRGRLRERLLPLHLQGPLRLVSRAKAALHGNPPYRAAEIVISDAMLEAGLSRVDFLGADPGMWSLHPPFRSPALYRELPALIARVEAGDVPEAQRGEYDLNDSLIDMSAARRRARLRRLWT